MTDLERPADPDTLCAVCNQTPERHIAPAFNDHTWTQPTKESP